MGSRVGGAWVPKPTEATLRRLNQPADWIECFVDEVVAHGVGLLLREDLGEVLVAVVVGERGDHDLRAGAAGLLAPSGDLVEPGPADRREDRATGLEELVGAEGRGCCRCEPGWKSTRSRSR